GGVVEGRRGGRGGGGGGGDAFFDARIRGYDRGLGGVRSGSRPRHRLVLGSALRDASALTKVRSTPPSTTTGALWNSRERGIVLARTGERTAACHVSKERRWISSAIPFLSSSWTTMNCRATSWCGAWSAGVTTGWPIRARRTPCCICNDARRAL